MRAVTPEIINIIDQGSDKAEEYMREKIRKEAYLEGWNGAAESFYEKMLNRMIERFGNSTTTDQVVVHQMYEFLDATAEELGLTIENEGDSL